MSDGLRAALDNLAQYPKSKNDPQQIIFRFGPKADKRLSEIIERNSKAVMDFFVDFHQGSKPYLVFNGSPEDKDWINAEMVKYGFVVKKWNSDGITFNYKFEENPIVWIYKEDWEGEKNWNFYSVGRQGWITHHVVHGIQARITGYNDGLLGCWPREGGANFYSWYIIGRTFPQIGDSSLGKVTYNSWRSEQNRPTGNWWGPKLNLLSISAAEWFTLIKSMDGNKPNPTNMEAGTKGLPIFCSQKEELGQASGLAYNAGVLLYEKLVGEFGHQRVMDWWYELRTTSDWEVAFEKTFKMNIDDWYKQSAIPYIMQEYRNYVYIPSN
jgi:hypothetical protein